MENRRRVPDHPSLSASNPKMSKMMVSGPRASNNMLHEIRDSSLEPSLDNRAVMFFPFRLTATLSALKIVCGCMLVGLGTAAMVQLAGYADKATGIYGGVLVIISGVLGAYTVRTDAYRFYVSSFLLSCLVSLVASVVIIIYSASGLAQDAGLPFEVRQDEDINMGSISVPSREAAMLINTMLIIVGFLDIIFSLPSVIICLRELCQCYNPALLFPKQAHGYPSGGLPNSRRLISWLGQQRPPFYSQSSGIPYAKMSSPGSTFRPVFTNHPVPPFIHIPSEPTHSVHGSGHSPQEMPPQGHPWHPRQRSKSPNPHQIHQVHNIIHPHNAPVGPYQFPTYPPLEVFTHLFYPQPHSHPPPPNHPSPQSHIPHHMMGPHMIGTHHPMHQQAPPPWVYGITDWENHAFQHSTSQSHHKTEHWRQKERDKRKRSRSKSQLKDGGTSTKSKRQRKEPTESDLDKTYTGMDRELAEEFIEQTMDPSVMIDQTMSATESEAW